MKKTIAVASLITLALIAGCGSSQTTSNDGSMGVVGSESKKTGSCTQKSECTDKPADAGSMGVMSDAKAGACEAKTSCPATSGGCPMQNKQN